ncbi:alkaline phosphatase family protein [Oculatella sp. LEGE 06141]|uniref:alkaline phosphatase family protein n=1 Tax=Oculatella sp. LEGE 06141 TaxID=1828648 RepID=UPI00187F9AF5|nr:alkaline phosphatase family protein [Oculatella sp. LEGE 06141]MBE9177119.1 alkaline phosphatase family protein [Oculatella sp. LEGE 06141]
MKRPVIAIGLDAADPALIERWMSQGHLSNLRRIREQGTYARVSNYEHYKAETPWTTFLTGCSPQTTGYWSPLKFHTNTYQVELRGAHDFAKQPPFYALGGDYRVAVFDIPQSKLNEQVNGLQVLGWGAHSAQTPSHSLPEPLFQDIINRFGEHPGFHKDHAECLDVPGMERLQRMLEQGIKRRSEICQDMLQQEEWDLFMTIFGETHAITHFNWHLSEDDHPLYEVLGAKYAGDPLLEVFEAVDQAIGEIIDKAPENAHIVVFSVHGMGANTMDLPSTVFLPELLYRYNFPGKAAIAPDDINHPPKPPVTACKNDSWLREMWTITEEGKPLKQLCKRLLPIKVLNKLEPLMGRAKHPAPMSPFELLKAGDPMFFQPSSWYQHLWPQMKAFALPSFSEGYIHINVRGREPNGMVSPSDYDKVCDELSQMLQQVKDGRQGIPMVKNIIRTRRSPMETDPNLPDADLVIVWQEEYATDTVDSPQLGRIGPVPHHRTGSHRSDGFFLAQGPAIKPGSTLPTSHALDITPTIMTLMGAPVPDYFDGQSMVQTSETELATPVS